MLEKNTRKVEIDTPLGPIKFGVGFFASMVVALRLASPEDTDAKIAKDVGARRTTIGYVRRALDKTAEGKKAYWLGRDITDELDHH